MHQVAGRTDIGCKRSNNEDAFGISRIEEGLLAVVCDGMGGHHGGEIASELAVNCFMAEVPRLLAAREPMKYLFAGAGNLAQCAIRQHARDNPGLEKMGTTLVGALVMGRDVFITHAGDSRCYVHDGVQMIQITRDDSVIQRMVDSGGVTEEDMINSPFKNMLTNSLSASQDLVAFSYKHAQLDWGNRLLLCSDGLTNTLGNDMIADILGDKSLTVEACVDKLIAKSLEHKAADNVTVVVIEIGGN